MSAKYGYLGNSPDTTPVRIARRTYTLSGVQTTFTFDAGYSIGYVDVYLNGVKQIENDDYLANNGSTVGFTSAPGNGDVVEIIAYKAYDLSRDNSVVDADFRVYGNSTFLGQISAPSIGVSGIITASSANISGVVTATSLTSNGINVSGVVTATSFVGSGANLTNLNIPVGFNEIDAALFS